MTWPLIDFSTSPPYTQKFDIASGPDGVQPGYVGWTSPGAATSDAKWAIRKFIYNASNVLTDIQWAGGSPTFNNIWDNRATLSYS